MFYLEREPVLIKQGPHAACNVIRFDAVADNAEIVLFHPHEGPADLIHATAWGRDWSLAEVAGYVTENDLPDDAGEREEPVTVLVYGQGGADADKVRRRLAQGSAGLVSESSAGRSESGHGSEENMNQESKSVEHPELSPIEILSFLMISIITADGEATDSEIDIWKNSLVACVGSGDPGALRAVMKGSLALHRQCAEEGVVMELTFHLANEMKRFAPEEQLEASLSLLARVSLADGEAAPEADELLKEIQLLWFGPGPGLLDAIS